MSDELSIRDQDGVRWISIERPASKNALTIDLNKRLVDALHAAAVDNDARAIVLTGRGGSFCSGADMRDVLSKINDGMNLEDYLKVYFHGLVRAVRAIEKPVIALVDGVAAGFGCDLSLICDIRIGTERTRFGEIFVKRGLMPDGGGTFTLPRLIGLGRALDLMFTGRIVEADEAERIGLINRRFPSATAETDVQALAAQLAKGPPLVYARIKKAAYASLEGTFDQTLARECEGQLALLRSQDFAEGMAAFFEKREASFTGQ